MGTNIYTTEYYDNTAKIIESLKSLKSSSSGNKTGVDGSLFSNNFSTSSDISLKYSSAFSALRALKNMPSCYYHSQAGNSYTNYPSNGYFKTANSGQVIAKINASFKGGLAGKGEAIVAAAEKYRIEPALFAAILAQESGYGKSGSGNNFGGLMDPATGCSRKKQFATVEQGLDAVAANLYKNYISQGLNTPYSIGPKYCPVGAANDKNGLNSSWIPSVASLQRQFSA